MNQAKSIDQALAEAFLKADHLEAPLPERLKLYLGESRELLPELESTYDRLVAPRPAIRCQRSERFCLRSA